MTFAKNRAYGVPEFAGTEVNRHSGNIKGLMGYLQTFHTHIATLIVFRQIHKGLNGLDHYTHFTKTTTTFHKGITTYPPHHQHIHHKTSSTLSSSHLKTENNNGVEVLLNFLHMEKQLELRIIIITIGIIETFELTN